jgi:hypothetical protein
MNSSVLVAASSVSPIAALRNLTFAAGTNCPPASRTVPPMLPVSTCASSAAHKPKNKNIRIPARYHKVPSDKLF